MDTIPIISIRLNIKSLLFATYTSYNPPSNYNAAILS